jgi:putative ABC transport system permease protein
MIWRHLQIAFRILRKNRLHSLINVSCLALATACCLLLYVYLRYEWSWDRFHENSENIHLVYSEISRDDGDDPSMNANTSMLFKETIEGKIPGIKSTTAYASNSKYIKIDEELVSVKVGYADIEMFDVFSVPLIAGSKEHLFDQPNSVVLTESYVEKYFPFEEPIGKSIDIKFDEEIRPFQITGVIENFPKNSVLKGEILLPVQIRQDEYLAYFSSIHWGMLTIKSYIMLEEGVDVSQVEASIKSLMDNLEVTHQTEMDFDIRFLLQPLNTYHIRLPFIDNPHNFKTQTDAKSSLILSGIALIILLIASINVTTLSIGRGKIRAREIGVRKVLGANRNELMSQFWVETTLLVLAAVGLGFVLAELFLPVFSDLTNLSLSINYDLFTLLMIGFLSTTLVFAAGGYPALILSSFPVMAAFKGLFNPGKKKKLRQALVVFQFTMTICLIAITLTMAQQLKYIQNRDLGYNDEQVVAFPVYNWGDEGELAVERFKTHYSNDQEVVGISGSGCLFGEGWTELWWEDEIAERNVYYSVVDYDLLPFLDVEFVEGRNFSRENPSDEKRGVVVNEAFVKEYGWEDPIGQQIGYLLDNEVIGVVKDFHYSSLHETINPMMMTIDANMVFGQQMSCSMEHFHSIQYVYMKIAPGKIVETMKKVEGFWAENYPMRKYNFHFLDESVQKMYLEERRWNKTITFSSIIAILIASMGLFGLAELQISQRLKEIGVRKVLGASSAQLISLFNREFVILVLGSTAVAIPIAMYILSKWFENFAYHVQMSPVVLGGAGLIALLIAVVTTSSQSFRAANSNPIEVLRDE